MKSPPEIPVNQDTGTRAASRQGRPGAEVFDLNALNYAHGRSTVRGRIRVRADDFRVEEILGFEPARQGAHPWVHIGKTLLNTLDVSALLARACEVAPSGLGARFEQDHTLRLRFILPAGSFATSLIRELIVDCGDGGTI